MSCVKKYVGWGERELRNTVGIISTGDSRLSRRVISDTEHFVRGVEHVFGDVGRTHSTGVSNVERPFLSGFKNFEGDVHTGVASDMRRFERGVKNTIKTFENLPKNLPASTFHVQSLVKGVSKAPKEIIKEAKTISTGVESGVNGFVNDVKSLFSRFQVSDCK